MVLEHSLVLFLSYNRNTLENRPTPLSVSHRHIRQPAFSPPAILLVETAPPTHPLFTTRKEAHHDHQHTPWLVSTPPTSSRLHSKPQPFKNNTEQNARYLHTISTLSI